MIDIDKKKCIHCGKKIENDKVFVCDECEKKVDTDSFCDLGAVLALIYVVMGDKDFLDKEKDFCSLKEMALKKLADSIDEYNKGEELNEPSKND